MNKQEVIEKLQSEARHHCGEKECYKDGCTKNVELDIAIDIINQLDEPEKPVVPQFVADWYEDNREALEEYVYSNVQIALSRIQDDNPMHSWLNGKGIGIIVDCVRNGYEIEKEKLYEVFLKRNGAQLGVCIPDGEDKTQFTEKELKEFEFDNLNVYEVKEVEE